MQQGISAAARSQIEESVSMNYGSAASVCTTVIKNKNRRGMETTNQP